MKAAAQSERRLCGLRGLLGAVGPLAAIGLGRCFHSRRTLGIYRDDAEKAIVHRRLEAVRRAFTQRSVA
jgi:hypothetical protein